MEPLERAVRGTRFALVADEHAAELVFLAGLEDREHRVALLELHRVVGHLGLAVAHDRDQPRALGQRDLA